MKKGNVLFGTIGAIIGSFAGVALYVGISLLKVFSSWSGAISLYCAIFMYTLFSRKLTKLGVVISIIVSCASMILANKYHIPFFEVFKNFLKVYPKLTNKGLFWLYPILACVFVIIGGYGYLVNKNKNDVEFFDDDYIDDEEYDDDEDDEDEE